MGRFVDAARKATTISELMAGREKMKMGDIIATYPNGVTVRDFDMVSSVDGDTGELTSYPIFVFDENDSVFAFGGTVFKNIVAMWLDDFDGDLAACRAGLRAEGVKIRFSNGVTRKGRPVTLVEVVG